MIIVMAVERMVNFEHFTITFILGHKLFTSIEITKRTLLKTFLKHPFNYLLVLFLIALSQSLKSLIV